MSYTILIWTGRVEFVILLLWCLRQMVPYKYERKPYDPKFETAYREALRKEMRNGRKN